MLLHDALKALEDLGVAAAVAALSRAVLADFIVEWIKKRIVHTKHDLALWVHGFEHVKPNEDHQPRNPFECRDGACVTLQTAGVPARQRKSAAPR